MIQLTRLNHVPLIVNSDLIEQVEVTPDTVITLTTGQKILVLESADDVVERVIRFRKAILSENGCRLRTELPDRDVQTIDRVRPVGRRGE
jgi:flagellar protein FlbD